MTVFNSFFVMYAGERKNLIFTVDDMTDLTGYTVTWVLMENEESTTELVTKQMPTITTSANIITVPLVKADTSTLEGRYYYQCKIIDTNNEDSVVSVGEIKIK